MLVAGKTEHSHFLTLDFAASHAKTLWQSNNAKVSPVKLGFSQTGNGNFTTK